MPNNSIITVVAAIIFNQQHHVLISSRPVGKNYAGYWEFPGGKLEVGESLKEALVRELDEELNISIHHATPWLSLNVLREHKQFQLHFWRVQYADWSGEIQGKEQQEWSWQNPHQITVSPILLNNQTILQSLKVPTHLSGSLKHILYDDNAQPYATYLPNITNQRYPLFCTFDDLSINKKNQQCQFCIIENSEQWQQVQDMTAIFWQINEHSFHSLCQILSNGCSIPILAINASNTQKHLLNELGIHGFIDSLPETRTA